jgi:hypothetical protein
MACIAARCFIEKTIFCRILILLQWLLQCQALGPGFFSYQRCCISFSMIIVIRSNVVSHNERADERKESQRHGWVGLHGV